MSRERVLRVSKSPLPNKKYRAIVTDGFTTRKIDFGDARYQQYRDVLRKYSRLDHGDKARRRAYFLRHSGVASKRQALQKERKASKSRLNARILSHLYLW
jgi:hypothetical protein